MKILLFGATDLTLAIANELKEMAFPPVGIVTLSQTFSISYRRSGVRNDRFVDMATWAETEGIPIHLFASNDRLEDFVKLVGADFALVAGWYHMVPQRVRALFPRGCAGLHASLLPRYRGGAPLNWAILDRAEETGVTLFELGDGVDDGPVYGQEAFPVAGKARIGDLVATAEVAAVSLIRKCIPEIAAGGLVSYQQVGDPIYTMQRIPEDGLIDWRQKAEDIDRLIRAVGQPYSGAYTFLDGGRITIWSAETFGPGGPRFLGAPGQLAIFASEKRPLVICGDGCLVITEATTGNNEDAICVLTRAGNQRFGPSTISGAA